MKILWKDKKNNKSVSFDTVLYVVSHPLPPGLPPLAAKKMPILMPFILMTILAEATGCSSLIAKNRRGHLLKFSIPSWVAASNISEAQYRPLQRTLDKRRRRGN